MNYLIVIITYAVETAFWNNPRTSKAISSLKLFPIDNRLIISALANVYVDKQQRTVKLDGFLSSDRHRLCILVHILYASWIIRLSDFIVILLCDRLRFWVLAVLTDIKSLRSGGSGHSLSHPDDDKHFFFFQVTGLDQSPTRVAIPCDTVHTALPPLPVKKLLSPPTNKLASPSSATGRRHMRCEYGVVCQLTTCQLEARQASK
jgi:hypothetical protein